MTRRNNMRTSLFAKALTAMIMGMALKPPLKFPATDRGGASWISQMA